MKFLIRIPFFITFLVLLTTCAYKFEHADLVIHNAKIYTLDENNTIVQAMAIKDGKIIETGAERHILNKYHADEYYDAQSRAVYPGFIDGHCHILNYGLSLLRVNLNGSKSFDEVLKRTQEHYKTNKSSWIIGRGWDQNEWEDKNFPVNTLLNEMFPDVPVVLTRVDGHAALVNQKALELAGINETTKIYGGEIVIIDGKLTGILVDNAMDLVTAKIPALTEAETEKALLLAYEKCIAAGLTTLDDAGTDYKTVMTLQKLQKEKKFNIRVYSMLIPDKENISKIASKGKVNTPMMHICSFKIVADGALGSRGACLKLPYHDIEIPRSVNRLHYGKLLFMPDQLDSLIGELNSYNYQVNTHCIGDSTNSLVMKLYAKYLEGANDKRWRIEHAQILDLKELENFRNFSIIPSVQPTHAVSDMPWAKTRVGEERMKGAYAYQTLLEQNGIIALGTDFPIEDISPIKTFYAAVTRSYYDGKKINGLSPYDTLSRMQALRGMTCWNAMANFEENVKGTIEKGKYADVIVLDHDLLRTRPEYILDTKVIATFINGKRVYSLE